jgi:hypothetical protein
LSTLSLEDAEWDPDQLQMWTEFGARTPKLKSLSLVRNVMDGVGEWAPSKLWEQHLPDGFPNLESFIVDGYTVKPLSVVRMFARYKTDAEYRLKRFSVDNSLDWRLGRRERARFTKLIQELSAVPQNKVEWWDLSTDSFFHLNHEADES